MADELTALGISVLALRRAHPMHGYKITGAGHVFPQFAVALPEVHILGDDAAAAVDDRVGTLEARAAGIMARRDARFALAGYLVAFDYLLATMQAERSWLQGFAGSMRSGRPGGQQTDGVAI
ncbi:MAG: hypothetical protein WAL22_16780 [Solirubrobacteraceae bacterium]